MANKPLKSIKFPGLPDTYTIEGLSSDAKAALLNCFTHVAWVDEHGQDYYDALYEALYEPTSYWDYEWNASSMTLPEGMTADYYDFTTESGAMFVKTPVLDLDYIGNCKLQIEMKAYSKDKDGEYVFSVNNNPQILIKNAVVGTNQFRGIKIIMDSVLGTSSEHGMSAVSVNGANSLIPESNSSVYHLYELTAENNFYTVTIDETPVTITQNTNTSAYYGRTGITTAAASESPGFLGAFIKSIKFKRL